MRPSWLEQPQQTCRICLLEKSDMTSILEMRNSIQIKCKIRICTNVLIQFRSNIPGHICLECLKELDISYSFKEKCERSEQLIKQYTYDTIIKDETQYTDNCEFDALSNCSDEEPKYVKNMEKIIYSCNKNVDIESKHNNDNHSDNINDNLPNKRKNSIKKTKLVEKIYDGNQSKDKQSENFKCETCNLQCQSKWVLKVHMRTHSGERPFQCELCLKRFVSKSNMRMHKKLTHNKDKQVCSECGKSFSCLTYLKRHLVIHSDVKPYGCTICEKRFTTKSYLKEHIARHKGDKKFFCEICGSKFISVVNLKQHMLVHGIQKRNFKKHQCTFCDYKTMGKVDLARHIRKHTGEKPFRCPHEGCQSVFAGKASLNIHIRIHTGEKPYTCTVCSAKFSRGDKFKNHMLKKHNITDLGPDKRSRLVVQELADAIENGHHVPIPIDIVNVSHLSA